MLTETATIVRVEEDAIWVMANQKSACGSCSAEKDCGTSTLAEWMSRRSLLRVDLQGQSASEFKCDDEVLIGIPEDVVVSGTVLLYLLPLAMLIAGASVGHWQFGSDSATAVFALVGLFVGGYLASRFSGRRRQQASMHPVLLEHLPTSVV